MSALTLPELLEEMRLHAKSAVVNLEPKRIAEWLAVLQAQALAPPPLVYVSADSPTPALVEHVDASLALAARAVELEQEVARWKAAFEEAQQDAERVRLESLRPDAKSVTQEVAEANLGQRCGFCLASKPEAELVNGECADRAACARGVQAAAGGAR